MTWQRGTVFALIPNMSALSSGLADDPAVTLAVFNCSPPKTLPVVDAGAGEVTSVAWRRSTS
jgi:hypothetical protein